MPYVERAHSGRLEPCPRQTVPVPRDAFSLLELLVAMSVLAILVVLMMGLVSSATNLWRASENRVDAYREGRAALSMIARDMRSTLPHANTNFFRVNASAFPMLSGTDVVTNATSAGALFFHAALPRSAQDRDLAKSDICQVGYFLAHGSSPFDRSPVKPLNLYRYMRSSDHTFQSLTNNPNAPFVNNITPRTVGVDGEVEILARNVRSFTVRPLTATNGRYVDFTPGQQPLPDVVDLTLVTINQETARKIPSEAEWREENGPLQPLFDQNEQTFTTRIHISQPPAPPSTPQP